MTRYLVVAHQTAESAALAGTIEDIVSEVADAEFVLVVPATPISHLFTWTEGESQYVAGEQAEAARVRFGALGAKVIGARVGDADPFLAVVDELREHPGYDAIIVSTLPAGISRWLKRDVISRLRRTFDIPIIHVAAEAPVAE